MFRLVYPYKEVTTVDAPAGTASFNTRHLHGDFIAIHVKPATTTTTWKMSIVGYNGLAIWDSKQPETGEQNVILWALTAVAEVLTVNITDASVNELFKIELRVREYQLR